MNCSTSGFPVLHYLWVCSNSCPLSQWCHSTILSSVTLFFSCPQSFPAPGSLPVNWLFTSGSQSIGASASALVLPMNIQGWSPLGLTGLRIDWFDLFAVQGTLKSLSQHHKLKASVLQFSTFFMVQLSYHYMTARKTIPLTIWTVVGKVMSLLFNTPSRFVIAFLPKSQHLLISWLQLLSAVILEPKNIKSVTVSTPHPQSICHEVMRPHAMILVFWTSRFKSA